MKRAMNYFVWERKFKPVERENTSNGNPILYETYGPELREVQAQFETKPNTVWTVVDCDGKLYISPGFHFVNRIAYVITTIPWVDEQRDVLY